MYYQNTKNISKARTHTFRVQIQSAKRYLQSTKMYLQKLKVFFSQSKNILLANWNKVFSNSARAYLQTWQITPISSQSLDDRPGIRRAPSTLETKQDPA